MLINLLIMTCAKKINGCIQKCTDVGVHIKDNLVDMLQKIYQPWCVQAGRSWSARVRKRVRSLATSRPTVGQSRLLPHAKERCPW